MKLVHVVSRLHIKTDKRNEFISIFSGLVEPTHKEVGCLQYELLTDDEDDSVLIVLETWETSAQFSNHINTEHFEAIYPKLEVLMTKEADVHICERVAFESQSAQVGRKYDAKCI